MIANYHTHCEFCDGKSTAAEMAEAALASGHAVLGFSSHSPLPFRTAWNMEPERFPAYLETVRELDRRYEGRLEVLAGLELDWIEGLCGPADGRFPGLDYRLGSVHYLRPSPGSEAFTVDEPAELFRPHVESLYGGDGLALARDYYRAVAAMVRAGGFDMLAHLDLVRMNNAGGAWFDEDGPGYRACALEAIDALEGTGIIVEINTGGIARGKTDSPYPAPWILRELRLRGVPVTVNADAHRAEHLSSCRAAGLRAAREAGYEELTVLTKRGRETTPLE